LEEKTMKVKALRNFVLGDGNHRHVKAGEILEVDDSFVKVHLEPHKLVEPAAKDEKLTPVEPEKKGADAKGDEKGDDAKGKGGKK